MGRCPVHDTPAHPTHGCRLCILEWEATDQAAGVALVRRSLPLQAPGRVTPHAAPPPPPPRDAAHLDVARARLDAATPPDPDPPT